MIPTEYNPGRTRTRREGAVRLLDLYPVLPCVRQSRHGDEDFPLYLSHARHRRSRARQVHAAHVECRSSRGVALEGFRSPLWLLQVR